MKKVKDILLRSEPQIFSVQPDTFVYDALQLMAKNEIGCVLVVDNDVLIGILSERDYARKVVLKGLSSWKTKVSQIMRTEFPVVSDDTPIEHCMALLTEHRIRYLPVMNENKLVGLISVHDVIGKLMSEQADEIAVLNSYVYSSR